MVTGESTVTKSVNTGDVELTTSTHHPARSVAWGTRVLSRLGRASRRPARTVNVTDRTSIAGVVGKVAGKASSVAGRVNVRELIVGSGCSQVAASEMGGASTSEGAPSSRWVQSPSSPAFRTSFVPVVGR